MRPCEIDFLYKFSGFLKLTFGFPRKTSNNVSGNRYLWNLFTGGFYQPGKLARGGFSGHAFECSRAARLQGQVQVAAQARVLP